MALRLRRCWWSGRRWWTGKKPLCVIRGILRRKRLESLVVLAALPSWSSARMLNCSLEYVRALVPLEAPYPLDSILKPPTMHWIVINSTACVHPFCFRANNGHIIPNNDRTKRKKPFNVQNQRPFNSHNWKRIADWPEWILKHEIFTSNLIDNNGCCSVSFARSFVPSKWTICTACMWKNNKNHLFTRH